MTACIVTNASGLGSVTLEEAAFETLNVTIEASATGSGGDDVHDDVGFCV